MSKSFAATSFTIGGRCETGKNERGTISGGWMDAETYTKVWGNPIDISLPFEVVLDEGPTKIDVILSPISAFVNVRAGRGCWA